VTESEDLEAEFEDEWRAFLGGFSWRCRRCAASTTIVASSCSRGGSCTVVSACPKRGLLKLEGGDPSEAALLEPEV